jgi:hypothetical protein
LPVKHSRVYLKTTADKSHDLHNHKLTLQPNGSATFPQNLWITLLIKCAVGRPAQTLLGPVTIDHFLSGIQRHGQDNRSQRNSTKV